MIRLLIAMRTSLAMCLVAVLLLGSFLPTIALAETQYFYDDLGRLILVAYSDGSSISYEHDAVGNTTAVYQLDPDDLTIVTFSPSDGPAGTQVTITGSGFNPSAVQNSVTFGGVSATVNSATTSSLVATVPLNAQTGPVDVETGGDSVTSSQTFVVLVPSISSFSPTFVNPGDLVVLNGEDLDLHPGSTSISVAGVTATVTSLSNTEAVFVAPATSGPIVVDTDYGQAQSATSLTVVPATINAQDVVDASILEPGNSSSLNIGQINKYGILEFDAVVGDRFALRIISVSTTPAGSDVQYELFSPTGTSMQSGAISDGTQPKIDLPQISSAGRHLIAFTSSQSSQTDIEAVIESYPTLDPSGPPLGVSNSVPGELNQFVFTATTGEDLSLAMTDLTMSGGSYVRINVYRPSGSFWTYYNCYKNHDPGCSINMRDVPETGEYFVTVDPYSQLASYTLTLSHHVDAGTLALDTPQTVAVAIPGQRALLDFTATQGQTLALAMDSITTTPTGKTVTMQVFGPTGSSVGSVSNATQATLNLTNLAAGTYTIELTPYRAATGSVQLELATGLEGSLISDGSSQNFAATVMDQIGYFTFDATTGEDLSLAMTDLTMSGGSYVRINVYRPSGSFWTYYNCYKNHDPGCSINMRDVPETGEYFVTVDPYSQLASYTLTLSHHVDAGTLALDTPQTVAVAIPGQRALLDFTATQGQTLALAMDSITTTPTGKTVTMQVFGPTGSSVGSVSNATQATLNLTNLAAGTYTIELTPYRAATGSVQLELATGLEGSLISDGSSQNFAATVMDQIGYFTFDATTGEDLSLAMTDLTMSGGSYVRINVYRPSGSFWTYYNCYKNHDPGCSINMRDVPETGEYFVTVDPYSQLASYTLTLSHHVDAGTLALDTPQTVAVAIPGQRALLDFTATQGQTLALAMDSITTTPTGKTVTMQVFGPTGSSVGSVSNATQATLNLTNLAAGTYTIELTPYRAATGSVQLELATGLEGSLISDGSSQNFAATVMDQIGYFTFDATTGEDLSLAMTDLTMSGGSYVRINVYRPSGSFWTYYNCYKNHDPGCSINMRDVPETGEYFVTVDPYSQLASYTLTLSHHVDAGTLALDTPQTVAVAIPGQRALLDFTATQGQTLALAMDSITTTPTGKTVTMQVFGPTGSSVGSVSNATQATLNLTNLAAGTYTIELTPYRAATGSVQLELQGT